MRIDDLRKQYLAHIKRLQQAHGLSAPAKHLTPKDRRALGNYWEIIFCKMAFDKGLSFTPLQVTTTQSGLKKSAQWYKRDSSGSAYLLPDIVIWTHPTGHHEIKHKDPFRMDQHGPTFGLEQYRLNALIQFQRTTKHRVFYTVHNHALTQGNLDIDNQLEHWLTTSVNALDSTHVYEQERGTTLYNGEYRERVILYWPTELWYPLQALWGNRPL